MRETEREREEKGDKKSSRRIRSQSMYIAAVELIEIWAAVVLELWHAVNLSRVRERRTASTHYHLLRLTCRR